MELDMPMICWSGGLDSTYLLLNLLKEQKEQERHIKEDDHPNTEYTAKAIAADYKVRTVSIIHPNISAIQEQRNARQQITKQLNKQGHHWPHTEIIITHKTPHKEDPDFEAQGAGDKGGIIQPIIWLPIATPYLHTNENLALGYIRGDDAQYYITTLRKAFDNLQWIAGRTGKLITPLDNTSKPEIIHWLKDAKLYQHCWYCENPKYPTHLKNTKPLTLGPHNLRRQATIQGRNPLDLGQPCKKCTPCTTHATALWQLKTGNYPNNILKLKNKRQTKKLKQASKTSGIPLTPRPHQHEIDDEPGQ